jgi:hypothetical protein
MSPKYPESFTANLKRLYMCKNATAVKTVKKIYSTHNKVKKLCAESTACHSNSWAQSIT